MEGVLQGGRPPGTIAKQLEALANTQLPRNGDCSLDDWPKLTHRGKQYVLESWLAKTRGRTSWVRFYANYIAEVRDGTLGAVL